MVPAGTLAEAHSPAEEGSPAVEDSHLVEDLAEGGPGQDTAAAEGSLQDIKQPCQPVIASAAVLFATSHLPCGG